MNLYSKKFVIVKTTEARELANEVYNFAGKKEKWISLYKLIESKGVHYSREKWEEAKKGRNPLPLWFWLMGQAKTIWKNTSS